jgi:hypothetical protein
VRSPFLWSIQMQLTTGKKAFKNTLVCHCLHHTS